MAATCSINSLAQNENSINVKFSHFFKDIVRNFILTSLLLPMNENGAFAFDDRCMNDKQTGRQYIAESLIFLVFHRHEVVFNVLATTHKKKANMAKPQLKLNTINDCQEKNSQSGRQKMNEFLAQ